MLPGNRPLRCAASRHHQGLHQVVSWLIDCSLRSRSSKGLAFCPSKTAWAQATDNRGLSSIQGCRGLPSWISSPGVRSPKHWRKPHSRGSLEPETPVGLVNAWALSLMVKAAAGRGHSCKVLQGTPWRAAAAGSAADGDNLNS